GASVGAEALGAAAKPSPQEAKAGKPSEREYEPETSPAGLPAPASPPLPTDSELPPMPAPAEPKGPSMWEEVLKNPTVKSGINTAIREAVKSIFGTGRRRK